MYTRYFLSHTQHDHRSASFAADVHASRSSPAFLRARCTRADFSTTRSMIIARVPSRPMYTRQAPRSRSFVAEPHALISQPHAARSSLAFVRGRGTRAHFSTTHIEIIARVRSWPRYTRSFLNHTHRDHRSRPFVAEVHALVSQPHTSRSSLAFVAEVHALISQPHA